LTHVFSARIVCTKDYIVKMSKMSLLSQLMMGKPLQFGVAGLDAQTTLNLNTPDFLRDK